jgi:transglutaminase-like putative cysteine protease
MQLRKGVCQDFAHVMLACLRSMGLPARYVSGYLLTEPPPGMTRLVGSDASHAWASVHLPDQAGGPGEWVDFDPTNNRTPGKDYVTLAIGRDYSDVSPVRGVLHGGAKHKLRVAVTVSPLEPGAPNSTAAPTIAVNPKESP